MGSCELISHYDYNTWKEVIVENINNYNHLYTIYQNGLSEYNKGLKEEYISLELLYDKIVNIYLDLKEETNENADIYSAFEKELGRTLSPMEYEIIKGWVMDKFSDELIILALKEAVYNGVNNLRYIDKVLYGWRKKNIKNKQDIIKDKEKFKNRQKENIEVFDYNWLDE